MKYLYLVWSGLKRKKLRTLFTVLSIVVAFILFGYLAAIRQSFNMGVEVAGADRLVVRHRVSIIQFLPKAYEARIERIPGVEAAAAATWFGGTYQEPKNFFGRFPVDPEKYLDMFPEFQLPEDQKAAWIATRTGAVAGRATAEKYGWKIGDRIPLEGDLWTQKGGGSTWEFDLVGIYDGAEKGTDNTQFLFHYDYFDEARAWGTGEVGWYTVRVDDPDRAAEIAQAIDDEFGNSPAETKAEPEGAFVQGFAKQVGNIGVILIGIVGAVFFTILLVSGNTMAQAVRERTQELAALKAIGFTHRAVLALVLAESCAVAMLGGFLGLGISWAAITAFGDPTPGFMPIFYFPTRDLIIGFLLVLALGLAAGALPAIHAQRLRIADALRR